ncbi:negative elongation factor C/D [Acrasis kona]|uniref:Negative elongation factor C/D n=1 Tax=Acrasis kona TaxID=1008807 RepID=A0AAW2ZGA3_9EUKA
MSHGNETPTSSNSTLDECEAYFKEDDAIMNPDVSQQMRKYLKAGGKPQVVLEMLGSSYSGHPQITDLMVSWMRGIGISEEQIERTIVGYVKGIISKHFDSQKADAIFSASNDAPKWLDFMVDDAEWRTLIYQLSEQHKNCLILNFAIQKISESAHHHEIASVTSASSSFRVFHRILTDSIEKLSKLDADTLQESAQFADFKKMCCHTQHTYIYAQTVLRALKRSSPTTFYFTRLSEELESHALKEQSGSESLVRKIWFLLIEHDYHTSNGGSTTPNQCSEIINALMSMLSANATNPSDITKLYKLYSSNNPPPAEFLHHRDVFQLFIKDLYSPNVKLNTSHKPKYVFLLAYAACIHPGTREIQYEDKMQEGDEAGPNLPLHFTETQRAVQASTTTCSNKTAALSSMATVIDIRKHIKYNVVCMGVLSWITVDF